MRRVHLCTNACANEGVWGRGAEWRHHKGFKEPQMSAAICWRARRCRDCRNKYHWLLTWRGSDSG
eukprot:27790-Eustigmatos_ZCMA.PRE.1